MWFATLSQGVGCWRHVHGQCSCRAGLRYGIVSVAPQSFQNCRKLRCFDFPVCNQNAGLGAAKCAFTKAYDTFCAESVVVTCYPSSNTSFACQLPVFLDQNCSNLARILLEKAQFLFKRSFFGLQSFNDFFSFGLLHCSRLAFSATEL